MTEPTKAAPAPVAKKATTVTDTVHVRTTAFNVTPQHAEEAEEMFRALHEGENLTDVKTLGVTHDIGNGVTYEFTATVK